MLLTRDQFREAVFARDKHLCVICGSAAVDAHHIMERRLWPDGGYYLDNGASVCEVCHLKAEATKITCEELRVRAGIQKAIFPQHLYDDTRYDKWGNPYVEGDPLHRRYKGELYHDESVAKVLFGYNDPGVFFPYVKYPRTYHLPWSPGGTDDDKRMLKADTDLLLEQDVVVTIKMDGENTNMYPDHIHARSLDSKRAADRDWVKNLWASIKHEIPTGWRLCGENLFAKHSIGYESLLSYFLLFSIWNDKNECLSWPETVEWAALLGLPTVPVLYQGKWQGVQDIEGQFKRYQEEHEEEHEGYVVRPVGSFRLKDFRKVVGKYVRANHVVQHARHWRRSAIEQNKMRVDE